MSSYLLASYITMTHCIVSMVPLVVVKMYRNTIIHVCKQHSAFLRATKYQREGATGQRDLAAFGVAMNSDLAEFGMAMNFGDMGTNASWMRS